MIYGHRRDGQPRVAQVEKISVLLLLTPARQQQREHFDFVQGGERGEKIERPCDCGVFELFLLFELQCSLMSGRSRRRGQSRSHGYSIGEHGREAVKDGGAGVTQKAVRLLRV